MNNERDKNGRFAPGCRGGPGRPRRTIEDDYLAALGDAVSLNDWREIVARAVADAKNGDARSRDWVAKHVVGSDPPRLADLAAQELRGESIDEVVTVLASEQQREDEWAKTTEKILGDLANR